MRGSALFDSIADAPEAVDDAACDCDTAGVRTAVQGHFRLLQTLIHDNGDLAKAVHRRAMAAAAAEGADEPAVEQLARLVDTYDRAVRSVRQCILLQDRLITALEVHDRRVANRANERIVEQGRAHERRLQARRARVQTTIERIARAEHDDDDFVERLGRETCEQLRGDRFGDLLNRPISDVIAQICRHLALTPDWARLAEEDWAKEERRLAQPRSPEAGLQSAPPSPLRGEWSGLGTAPPLQRRRSG